MRVLCDFSVTTCFVAESGGKATGTLAFELAYTLQASAAVHHTLHKCFVRNLKKVWIS